MSTIRTRNVAFVPVETVSHPTKLESGTKKISFRFILTAYN